MLRFLIAGAIAIALGISFLVTSVLDELAPPGTTDVITVWDASSVPSTAFHDLVDHAAHQNHMTVMKQVLRESGDQVIRTQFVFNPDDARTFPPPGPRQTGFDPALVTEYRPSRELPGNRINGMYSTDAGTEAADRFERALSSEGITVTVNSLRPVVVAMWVVGSVPVLPLGAALAVVVVVGVATWQSARRNVIAINAVWGRSIRASAIRDALSMAGMVLTLGVLGTPLVIAVSAPFNGGARADLFALLSAIAVAGTATLAGLATLAANAMARTSIRASIGGGRPWRRLAVIALMSNFAVLALTVGAAGSAWAGVTLARADADERPLWASSSNDVRLNFESSISDLETAMPGLAAVYEELDTAGSAILAEHNVDPDLTSHHPNVGNVLIVNAQYLQERPLMFSNGERVTRDPLDPQALTLLVPDGTSLSTADRRAWGDFLELEREVAVDPGSFPADTSIVTRNVLGSSVFNYATDDLAATSTQERPVIAVLPTARKSMAEEFIVAAMTTGEIVFTDQAALRQALDERGLEDVVATIDPLRDVVSYRSAVHLQTLQNATAALVVAALAMLVSAAVTGHSISMIRRTRTAIAVVHGRTRSAAIALSLVVPATVITTAGTAIAFAMPHTDRGIAIAATSADALILVVVTEAFHAFPTRLGRKEHG